MSELCGGVSSGICSLAVYVIVGVLYQRLVVGAKGVDQFPHHPFWMEIGNLSAVSSPHV